MCRPISMESIAYHSRYYPTFIKMKNADNSFLLGTKQNCKSDLLLLRSLPLDDQSKESLIRLNSSSDLFNLWVRGGIPFVQLLFL